jgi:hypothetical protein
MLEAGAQRPSPSSPTFSGPAGRRGAVATACCLAWLLLGTGCLAIRAKPIDSYPNIRVPAGPPGHLSSLEILGVPDEACDSQGVTTYCIQALRATLEKDITRLLGEYLPGGGPGFRGTFTFKRFAIGDRSTRCGKGVCTAAVPLLEWHFELARADHAEQPLQIAQTTYSEEPYNIGTYQLKTKNKSADSLLKQVISAINAGLPPGP